MLIAISSPSSVSGFASGAESLKNLKTGGLVAVRFGFVVGFIKRAFLSTERKLSFPLFDLGIVNPHKLGLYRLRDSGRHA